MQGDQRQVEDELEQEIAVAGDVEAVGGDGVEAELAGATLSRSIGSDVPASAAAPERQDVDALAAVGQPLAVALELLDVGEEVVRRQHRLGPLQVRVAGQDDVAVALGRVDERPLQLAQPAVEVVDGVAHPELDVGDDLVVAAAAGVQLAADVAEPLDQGPLDVRVDVFELDGERELAALDLGRRSRRGRRRSARPRRR